MADLCSPFQPRELSIEVTEACNLACTFCYQGEAPRSPDRHALEDQVLGWIDWAVENGVPAVRFTGGEPTLHPGIRVFCNYARLRGRIVVINSNGMSPSGLYAELLRVIHHLDLSLPLLDPERLDHICGGRQVLPRKLALLRQALAAGRRVAICTPLLPENLGHLERFARLVRDNPGASWNPLRLKATPSRPRPWSREEANAFANEMAGLLDAYPELAEGVRLATPFCAVEPISLGARVFRGRAEQCGPFQSLVAGMDGKLRACYGSGQTWDPAPLAEIAQSAGLQNCAGLASLPQECQACPYVPRCAGACQACAGLVEHHGHWVDYLANLQPRGTLDADVP